MSVEECTQAAEMLFDFGMFGGVFVGWVLTGFVSFVVRIAEEA